MNDKAYILTKKPSNETIESWSKRSYIGKELREKLVKADALIIPKEDYGDDADMRFFPEGTEHLISFLQRKEGDQYIDICIEEGDYKELAEHVDLIVIAGAIVTTVCAPVLVNLISEYLQQRLDKRASETTVKASLTISDASSGKSISLTYEGPASTYKGIMLGAVKEAITEGGEFVSEPKVIGKASNTRGEQ
jgi:hypothetical protein